MEQTELIEGLPAIPQKSHNPDPAETKPKKERARGVLRCEYSAGKYRITCRQSGLEVRKNGSRVSNVVSLQRVIDFTEGQSQLPLDASSQSYGNLCMRLMALKDSLMKNPNSISEIKEVEKQIREKLKNSDDH